MCGLISKELFGVDTGDMAGIVYKLKSGRDQCPLLSGERHYGDGGKTGADGGEEKGKRLEICLVDSNNL